MWTVTYWVKFKIDGIFKKSFMAFSQYMNFSKELGNATNYLIKKTFRMVIAFRKWLRSIRILCRNYKYLNHCLQIFVLPFSQVVQNTRVQVLWEGCKIWKKKSLTFSNIFSNFCGLFTISELSHKRWKIMLLLQN